MDTETKHMSIPKVHQEFETLNMDEGWQVPPGYPPSIAEKILSGSLDQEKKFGNRTRLLRFLPGAFTTEPFVHDYWEEVFLVTGDLVVGSDAEGKGGMPFLPFTYACRPPGVDHGPFRSEQGCVLFEVHYYDPEN